jgi:hypothetical protein
MPVVEKRQPRQPLELIQAPATPAYVTAEQVGQMLKDRDATWASRLADMEKRLMSAIQSKPAPMLNRKPVHVEFRTDKDGTPTGFTIKPEN